MKIYTRTGDAGTTALFGGDRVVKSHPRIQAYGTVDETNAVLGMARSHLSGAPGHAQLDPMLARIQEELFVLGADLATPAAARPVVPRIEAVHIEGIERDIDRLEADLPPLNHFILPGGTPAAAALHLGRTVCRRAERLTVEASAYESISPQAIVYLNRLSDFLFVAARWANHAAGAAESTWLPPAPRQR